MSADRFPLPSRVSADRSPTRRDVLKSGAALAAASVAAPLGVPGLFSNAFAAPSKRSTLPTPRYDKLPRWRGFNLLEKFMVYDNKPFREDDFRNIADLGFNFVRLPMDYRCWIVDGDRKRFNEKTLAEIDKAVEYGDKYGVHVCMNFHRAPGYTVANPPERPTVWKDAETLAVCAEHWRVFAKRYAGYPNELVSFNLFNEPDGCSDDEFMKVVSTVVDAIRSEDADRLISCDGLGYGTRPYLPLAKLRVAQATRGYAPMEVSHCGASWVNYQDFPAPRWPGVSHNALMPQPNKGGLSEGVRKPWTVDGPFPNDATLRLRVGTVSVAAEIVVEADGREILRRRFVPQGGKGEWKEAVFVQAYNVYQNVYDLDLTVKIPNGAKRLTVANVDGDWATITEIAVSAPNVAEVVSEGGPDWGAKEPTAFKYAVKDGNASLTGGVTKDRAWLKKTCVEPWQEAEKHGIGVMVGEFGAFNKTPIDVVRRWMEDMLLNWREAGWGWALWNFRGSFGIADSGRADVDYEDWRGLKLDRETLKLLQKY